MKVYKRRPRRRLITVDLGATDNPSLPPKPKAHPDATKVSQSRINTWRKCKYEHHLKFNEKIQKKRAPKALYKGKIIHEIIEAIINKEDWRSVMEDHLQVFDEMFEEEKVEYGDMRTELPIIMEGYHNLYKNDGLTFLEKDGKKAEHDFSIPLDGKPYEESRLLFNGKIDAIAQDSYGRVWLTEHKSFTNLPDENFRFINQQGTLYSWVMPQIGFPEPDGVLWDYIRTKVPTVPRVLKSGGLSKAKADTTYDTYMKAILENGLDPKDYEEILQNLDGQEINFYRRIFLPTRKSIIKPVVQDLKETALEIHKLGDITKARNLGRHCSYCSFRSICQAELQGHDADFIRKSEYEPSTYHLTQEEESNGEA